MSMEQKINRINERIEYACRRANRKSDEITVVAVTKGIDLVKIQTAYALGLRIFGENRVQEAKKKIDELSLKATWHLIGHLQTNKVKYAVNLFDMIQSLDSVKLISELAKRTQRKLPVLLEINTSGEPQKHGATTEDAFVLTEHLLKVPNLELSGLMTVGPYPVEENKTRTAFSLLRSTKEKLEKEFEINLPVLSMGMTEDFEYAILEGSTMVRIGRGIFGERKHA